MVEINAIGDVCPVPVIKAKNALKEMPVGGRLAIRVDNVIATENLKKLADESGASYELTVISENDYEVRMVKNQQTVNALPSSDNGSTVVVVSSDKMGEGHAELGGVLMKGFIFALSELDNPPQTIIFYNGGANITTEGSECLEDLIKLENKGTRIMTCGTCLNYYGLEGKLKVGGISNMYSIVEEMSKASKIIKP